MGDIELIRRRNLIEASKPKGNIWASRYLTFEAVTNCRFEFTDDGLSYSLDEGVTWIELPAETQTPVVTSGNKIMFKGQMVPEYSYGIGNFNSSTGSFNVMGNIMSLLYGDNFMNQTDLQGMEYAFDELFLDCYDLVDAHDLILPAKTLANYCYEYMFDGCVSLTTAPELPATTLANYCYRNMFNGCTSLTTVPELPATTLENGCYRNMFSGCTSLTTAPELPATTLALYGYYNMFFGCTSLTTAPELPATTLARNCYRSMFQNCSRLNYIKAMFTTTPSDTYTSNWVSGVSSTGTFVKNSAATWNVIGDNGIPSGWTVETANG
jgi:hypothetical protein